MKNLIIIRHAKSSWDVATLNDFDRTLNDRGQRDAPMMAKRLLQKNISIDASKLSSGFYLLQFSGGGFNQTEKVVVR